jgi:glycosyltransferase involved in cell wall biosynthesis
MNLSDARVGYVPYSPDFTVPGDRRRFVGFARKLGLNFEIADINKDYDVVLVTIHSDLSAWIAYKKKRSHVKLIFEMVDSMIFSNDLFRDVFKGVGRYFIGKESDIYLSYKTPIFILLKMADAVICSSNEIKNIVSRYNKNVFVSLDYFQDEILSRKQDFRIQGKIKLAWEGQGIVLENLLSYKGVFEKINADCELHIITDAYYNKFGNFLKTPITKIIDQLPITSVFHEWEKYKNYEILSQCDIGIIPLNPKNKMAWHKPANKLISFWYAGIPTIVSNTPAYVELMSNADCDLFCSNTSEWVLKIISLKNMSEIERQAISKTKLQYVLNNYSTDDLDKSWLNMFEFILKNKE